eukprot:13966229-Alexandrium_andersonii.AAC.1
MAPWSGAEKAVQDMVQQSSMQLAEHTSQTSVHVDKGEFLRETKEKKTLAIQEAREKLKKAQGDSAKRRRISVNEATVNAVGGLGS